MRVTSPRVVGLGLVLALTAHPTGALGVTPDLDVLAHADRLRVEQSDSAADEYLRNEALVEETVILTSDVIALGTVERTEHKLLAPEHYGVWGVEVILAVEDCLKGACGERVTFHALPMHRTGYAGYEEGERILVTLVPRGRGVTRSLQGHHEGNKYIVDSSNTVVRKGLPLDDLLAEVRELVAPRVATRLFEESELVVIGEVVSVERGGTAEEADSPGTLRWGEGASIRVTQWLKGASDRTHMTVLSTVPTREQIIHDYVILEPGEVVLQVIQIELGDGQNVTVENNRVCPFVFAPLLGDFVRHSNRDLGRQLPDDFSTPNLVTGIGIRVEEADSNGFNPFLLAELHSLRYVFFIEGIQHLPFVIQSLLHFQAQVTWDEWLGLGVIHVV